MEGLDLAHWPPSTAVALLPPPPLPPVSDEFRTRLETLEVQRSAQMHAEMALEMRVERLRSELGAAEAAAARSASSWEVQLELCNRNWGTRVNALEASEAAAAEQVQRQRHELELDRDRSLAEIRKLQAAHDTERQRLSEEATRLRAEVQQLQDNCGEAETRRLGMEAEKRRLQAEVGKLQEDARQAVNRSEFRAREMLEEMEAQRELLQMRCDTLDQQARESQLRMSEEAQRSGEASRAYEERIRQLESRAGGFEQSSVTSAQRLDEAQRQLSELARQLRDSQEERAQLAADNEQLRRANGDRQRAEELLQNDLAQESRAVRELAGANELLELELREAQARGRLRMEGEQMRRMFASGDVSSHSDMLNAVYLAAMPAAPVAQGAAEAEVEARVVYTEPVAIPESHGAGVGPPALAPIVLSRRGPGARVEVDLTGDHTLGKVDVDLMNIGSDHAASAGA